VVPPRGPAREDGPQMTPLRRRAPALVLLLVLAACAEQPALVTGDGLPDGPSASPAATPTATPSPTAEPAPSGPPEPAPAPRRTAALPGGERVTLRIAFGSWASVSWELDSTSDVSVEDDLPTAARARLLDDLGEEQVPLVDGKYPTEGQRITLTLSRSQWAFGLNQLREAIPIYEEIEDPESAALLRAAVADIERALRDPVRVRPVRSPGKATAAGVRLTAEAYSGQLFLTPFTSTRVKDPDDLYSDEGRLIGVWDGPTLGLRTGTDWADVDVTIRAVDAAPPPLEQSMTGWELGEEVTLRVSEPLHGLDPVGDHLTEDMFVPGRPGLYRVRALARGRAYDDCDSTEETCYDKSEGPVREHYDVTIWPVDHQEPLLRVGTDALAEE
jgi:hypothetical protein